MFKEIELFKDAREFYEFAVEEFIDSEKKFNLFLDNCDDIEDLEQFKQACINVEAYEWAAVIQKQLNEL